MTLPTLRRPAAPRPPVLVSITTHFARTGNGFARECWVRLASGELVLLPVSEERLVALGAVAA